MRLMCNNINDLIDLHF